MRPNDYYVVLDNLIMNQRTHIPASEPTEAAAYMDALEFVQGLRNQGFTVPADDGISLWSCWREADGAYLVVRVESTLVRQG